MKTITTILTILLTVGTCGADPGEPIPWPKNDNPRVTIMADGNIAVTGDAGPTRTTLLTLEEPKVPTHQYRLSGKIKYENVQGIGHIEMLSRIPNKGEFFSRTLGEGGPMGKLAGSSDWRDLELPFFSEPGLLPDRLTINVVLPGGGKVWITPLTISEIPEGHGFAGQSYWGGLIGAVGGCLGAAIGVLGAFAGTRRLGLWLSAGLCLASCILLVAGLVFWQQSAPYDLWYNFLLGGFIGAVVSLGAFLTLKSRINQDEMRKMQAMDAGA